MIPNQALKAAQLMDGQLLASELQNMPVKVRPCAFLTCIGLDQLGIHMLVSILNVRTPCAPSCDQEIARRCCRCLADVIGMYKPCTWPRPSQARMLHRQITKWTHWIICSCSSVARLSRVPGTHDCLEVTSKSNPPEGMLYGCSYIVLVVLTH